MLPWLQTNFNYPLSGNVSQKIEPDWFFDAIHTENGDGEIEKEIFMKVASYGRQIGILTEALLAMADSLKLDAESIETLSRLQELQEKVDTIKNARKGRLMNHAKSLLEKLKASDPEGFRDLLENYRPTP